MATAWGRLVTKLYQTPGCPAILAIFIPANPSRLLRAPIGALRYGPVTARELICRGWRVPRGIGVCDSNCDPGCLSGQEAYVVTRASRAAATVTMRQPRRESQTSKERLLAAEC